MAVSSASAAAVLGRIRSRRKAKSSRINGRRGGRPRQRNPSDMKNFGPPLMDFAELESGLMSVSFTIADLVRRTLSIVDLEKTLIVGGLVLHKYAKPRATIDLDLVVVSAAFDEVGRTLLKSGFRPGKQYEYEEPHRFIHKFSYRGREVDLLDYRDEEFTRFLFKTARPFTIFDKSAKTVSPEAFVLTKLIAANAERGGRGKGMELIGQDFVDIRSIVDTSKENRTVLNWKLVGRWATKLGIEAKLQSLNTYLGRGYY